MGDFVDVVVWPLDQTLTNPALVLDPPPTDGSKTPLVFGGNGAWLSYVLSSTGQWGIGVGTRDLFGKGRYAVKVYCSKDQNPGAPQSCVGQNLTCGQTIGWTLTAQSCSFNGSTRPYEDHWIYATAGDFFNAEVSSSDFSALVSIYDDNGGAALAVGQSPVGGTSRVAFSIPKDGWYSVLATTANQTSLGGFYTVTVNCFNSGCIPPLIVEQPVAPKTIKFGDRVNLSVRAQGVGPLTYTWFDVDGTSQTVLANTQSYKTLPIKSNRTLKVVVETHCGQEESNPITLSPAPVKRHAAKH